MSNDIINDRSGSLRKRWLLIFAGLVFALGLICVAVITTIFASDSYSNAEKSLKMQAQVCAELFSEYGVNSREESYNACLQYIANYKPEDDIRIQLINKDLSIAADSDVLQELGSMLTAEVSEAIESRGLSRFMGKDPVSENRIIAVSCPIIYKNGEILGILRYVMPLKSVDQRVYTTLGISLAVLILIEGILVVCSNFFIGSIMSQIAEITEKAKKIANGSYGVQIQTKYHDEIGELASTINELSVKISENEKLQTEFISSLSHELRTPLTAITGWSETLLAGDELSRENRRGMRIIWREAKRLTEMVVDLLDFTRIQGGRMTLNIEETDIRGEFEDTVYMYSSRLAQDGITLNYLDNDDDIPEIPCDSKRMRQVFLNILDNAAKHGEGKDIEATMNLEGDMVVVRIRDFGPGIPEDEIPLVKKKFFKGSSKARGSGIGLAVSDEIVEMHGGALTLENADGGGTLVTISLPISQ